MHFSGSSFQGLTPIVPKVCASCGRSHYCATEVFLMACLTCRYIGDMHCYLLWVFIAKSETNVFNFTAAALGSSNDFWMDTCNARQTTAEQVSDWHSQTKTGSFQEQWKGCCVISSIQALFPTLPTNKVLCRTPHHEQQTRAESPGKAKNFCLEVRLLSEPFSVHKTVKNDWVWDFGRNVAFSVNHSFKLSHLYKAAVIFGPYLMLHNSPWHQK